MIDKERFVEILKNKLEEGYEVVKNVNIASEDCRRAIVNMFEIEGTIKGLTNATPEAKELNDFDAEMERLQIEKALAKNTDVEVEMGGEQ